MANVLPHEGVLGSEGITLFILSLDSR